MAGVPRRDLPVSSRAMVSGCRSGNDPNHSTPELSACMSRAFANRLQTQRGSRVFSGEHGNTAADPLGGSEFAGVDRAMASFMACYR